MAQTSNDFFSKYKLFDTQRVPWFNVKNIISLTVQKNVLFLATTDNKIHRAHLNDPSRNVSLQLPCNASDKVHRVFLDPEANHFMISMKSGSNYYINAVFKKLRFLGKAKNIVITAIAWNRYNVSQTTTQPILIGSSTGDVYEAVLYSEENLIPSADQSWAKLLSLDSEILAIELIRNPPQSTKVGEKQRCVTFVVSKNATNNSIQLHQYSGLVSFEPVVRSISTQAAAAVVAMATAPQNADRVFSSLLCDEHHKSNKHKCIEFRGFKSGRTSLSMYQPNVQEVPQKFALATGQGIFHAQLASSYLAPEDGSQRSAVLINRSNLIPFENAEDLLGIRFVEFHLILVYRDRIKAINILDQSYVYSQSVLRLTQGNPLLDICLDLNTNRLWLFSNTSLIEFVINDEREHVWRIYLKNGDYVKAREYCPPDPANVREINVREAEHCFDSENYIRSAELYAQTEIPFEEISLRFSSLINKDDSMTGLCDVEEALEMDASDEHAAQNMNNKLVIMLDHSRINLGSDFDITPLKTYLEAKLEYILSSGQDLHARKDHKIILIWIVQLILCQIASLREANNSGMLELRNSLRQILQRPQLSQVIKEIKEILYTMFTCHGNDDELIFFTQLMQDYPKLIDFYVARSQINMALKIISASSEPAILEKQYQYGSLLAVAKPKEFVDHWIRLGDRVNFSKILAAILLLPVAEARRYLEFVIDTLGSRTQACHHQLMSIYASTKDEAALLDYFKRYTVTGSLVPMHHMDLTMPDDPTRDMFDFVVDNFEEDSSAGHSFELPYDAGFALRLCKENHFNKASIFLLQSMNMFELAMNVALSTNDVDLCKEIASNDQCPVNIQKKLWLLLARHMIKDSSNIDAVTMLLKECSVLQLGDILPFFRNFVTIDQFKETICDSLDSYNSRIKDLKAYSKQARANTEKLHSQIKQVKAKPEKIKQNERCVLCFSTLIIRAFYLFPCGHHVHQTCQDEMMTRAAAVEESSQAAKAECTLCGDVAINAIDHGLFPDADLFQNCLDVWR